MPRAEDYPEHKRIVAERADLIRRALEPLGDLGDLWEYCKQSYPEAEHSWFYCWQLGYRARQADERIEALALAEAEAAKRKRKHKYKFTADVV